MSNKIRKFKYQTDKGNIFYAVTVGGDEWAPVRGTPPTGNLAERMTCRLSKNANETGIRPRYAVYARAIETTGDPGLCIDETAEAYKFIVVLTQEHALNLLGNANPPTVSYQGQTYKFKSLVEEDID